jgi:hypothetical protein
VTDDDNPLIVRKLARRLVPLLVALFVVALLDRGNLAV